MIRHAFASDLPAVEESFEILFEYERAHGSFSGWRQGIYPKMGLLEDALREERLYVMRGKKDKFLGSMVLGGGVERGLTSHLWRFPAENDEILSIDVLCIPPEEQGRGYGTQMIGYALKVAASRSLPVVRLAAYDRNEPILGLCKKLGFERSGSTMSMLGGILPQRQIFLEHVLGH